MLPIRDNIPREKIPFMTWTIIAINVIVFASQVGLPHPQVANIASLYGVVPARYTHPIWAHTVGFPSDILLPLITGMFLHASWLHVIFNMWSLWIFGDNVEERLGSLRFAFYYLLCGACAWVVHIAANPSSTVPAVGASGAIAGVLAAYLVLYPTAWVLCLLPIFIFPIFFELPAIIFIGIWFLSNFLSGTASLLRPGEGGGPAWWAHIGGFAGGLLMLSFFLRGRPPRKPPARIEVPVRHTDDVLDRYRRGF